MLDQYTRNVAASGLQPVAARLERRSISPGALTGAGLIVGVAACVAVGLRYWWLGLALWVLNRVFDGLDGLVARINEPTKKGGFFDIVADFTIYSGFVVAVAVALPETRLAAAVLLMSYYVSGAAFLAWSSLVSQENSVDDPRSLKFIAGLAEGTETIVAYVLICLFWWHAETIMWAFSVIVFATAGQRLWWANKTLT